MKELEIKKVPFMGSELMATRDLDGQIWAGVRWMCEGIGLSKGQTNGEITKIGSDEVLKEGNTKFRIPTNSGLQETLCLKLDFVPLWLAKINITPNMKAEHPELAETLKQYQLRAKDVLAAAFLPQAVSPQKYPHKATSIPFLWRRRRENAGSEEHGGPSPGGDSELPSAAGL